MTIGIIRIIGIEIIGIIETIEIQEEITDNNRLIIIAITLIIVIAIVITIVKTIVITIVNNSNNNSNNNRNNDDNGEYKYKSNYRKQLSNNNNWNPSSLII